MKTIIPKLIQVPFTLLFLANILFAQVNPGKGFGEIKLGDTHEKVNEILGKPQHVWTRDEEEKNYEESNYNIKIELPFFLKFEDCLEYSLGEKDIPVFKIFFKENKVIFLTISSYMVSEEVSRSTGTPQAVHLLDQSSVMEAAFGPNYQTIAGNGSEDWLYFEKGIGANVEENEIKTFYIFPPLNEKMITKFTKICNKYQ